VDPYLRYYAWETGPPEDVRDFVQMFVDQQHERPRRKRQLASVLRQSGELIGNCGIRVDFAGAHEADIGYELAPEQWGHGYATEAARAVLALGFTKLHVHRISASCIAENTGSQRVLETIGMQLEGRQRDKEQFKGRRWDTLLFAILEDAWRARQAGAGT
jgi:ribosomal-protein-alanine N-acetyltransferase